MAGGRREAQPPECRIASASHPDRGARTLRVTLTGGGSLAHLRLISFYPFGVLRAGRNPTQQFVGSYNIDIYPNQNNTITFVLTNVTSLKSGTYHIGPEYPRSTVGLGGNQTQIYTWTEPARLPAYTK